MNEFINFIQNNYNQALTLKEKFCQLEKKKWNSLTVTLELMVQLGHTFNVLNKNILINENGRSINDLGDELSDMLLQLSYLSFLENINLTNLEKYNEYDYNDLNGLPILLGQLTEALLEDKEYRFTKKRVGFASTKDFIKDRIIKMFLIIFHFASKNNININNSFNNMVVDATKFIESKVSNGNN